MDYRDDPRCHIKRAVFALPAAPAPRPETFRREGPDWIFHWEPCDAVLVGAGFDAINRTITLLLQHPSFAPTDYGAVIPLLEGVTVENSCRRDDGREYGSEE